MGDELGDREGFDSNIFVQESRTDWSEHGCNEAHPLVILSGSEESHALAPRFFAAAQNDKWKRGMTLEATLSLLT